MASFDGSPQKRYVAWRPNQAVVRFFEDMARRRIPATQQDSLPITNTSPPTSGQYATKRKRAAPSNSGASQKISRTAQAQLNCKPGSAPKTRAKRSSTRKRSANATTNGGTSNGQPRKRRRRSGKKRKAGDKKGSSAAITALERRLRKVKL